MDQKRMEAALRVTLGRCAKELTGPLVHTYQCLARTVAVHRAFPLDGVPQEGDTPDGRFEAFVGAYTDVYTLLEHTQEPVMDFWKGKLKLAANADELIADALQAAVNLEQIDEAAFALFLPEGLHGLLHQVLDEAGHSLRNVRKTGAGRAISSGRNWKGRYDIVDQMLKQGRKPWEILPLLEKEITGEAIVRLKVKKVSDAEKTICPGEGEHMELLSTEEEAALDACSQVPGLTVVHFPITNLKELVEAVRYEGRPIFRLGKVKSHERALITAQIHLTLPWKERTSQGTSHSPTASFELTFPDPWYKSAQVTPDGHVKLRLSNGKARMFRPVLFLTRDHTIGMKRAEQWLADVLFEGALAVDRLWGNPTGPRVREAVTEALRAAFMKLTICDKSRASTREALIRRSEYQVEFAPADSTKGGWRVKRATLRPIGEAGYDLYTTSKNHPGTVVTRVGKHGLPSYKLAISPVAIYQDGKRLCEEREQRQALKLWQPVSMPLTTIGMTLPEELAECMTVLTVVIADSPHVNRFLKIGGDPQNPADWTDNDTFVGFPSIKEKIAIGEIRWEAESAAERDALMGRLLFDHDCDFTKLTVDTVVTDIASGLSAVSYLITYTGRWDEVGKLKAAVGGGKAVVGVLPFQPYYKLPDGTVVPIDLMIPRATVGEDGKKMLEMLLWMLAAKAGITELHPATGKDLQELVALIRWRLEQGGRDPEGLETIWVENPDGTTTIAGKAVCGPVPFYRPKQTASNQFRVRRGMNGIKVHTHAMIMGVRRDETGRIVDRIRFRGPEGCGWGNEETVYHHFTRLIQARQKLIGVIDQLNEGEPERAPARSAAAEYPNDPGMQRLADLHTSLTVPETAERAPLPEAPPEEEWEEVLPDELPLWVQDGARMVDLFWDAEWRLWLVRESAQGQTHEPITGTVIDALRLQWEKELQHCPNATGAAELRELSARFQKVLSQQPLDLGEGPVAPPAPSPTAAAGAAWDTLMQQLKARTGA